MSIFDTIKLAAIANDFTITESDDRTVTTYENAALETTIRVEWDGNLGPRHTFDKHGDVAYAYHNCAGDSSSIGTRYVNGRCLSSDVGNLPLSLIVVHWMLSAKENYAAVTQPGFDGGA